MRDLFGLLAIALAVVALGLFRVPEGDALVARGIAADARGAVSGAAHPLEVVVSGRTVTVSGPVDREADRIAVLNDLRRLDGVEQVRDRLVVLPQVAPFALGLARDGTATGHVPDGRLVAALAGALGAEVQELPLAAGAPPGWGEVALRGARALALLNEGRMDLTGADLVLSGVADLPATVQAIRDALADLPDGFSASLDLTALDDGLPYGLSVTRDPRMGLRIAGKLPPGFDLAAFDTLGPAQANTAVAGPVDLGFPGLDDVVLAALPVFATLPQGALSVAPGVVSLSGGPVAPGDLAAARAMVVPAGWRLDLALVPQDDGAPLSLLAEWDGSRLVARGKVPADFSLDFVDDATAVTLSPYPDLAGWSAPVQQALTALRRMDSGRLEVGMEAPHVSGRVPDPTAAAAVRAAMPADGVLEMRLRDDGTPPRISLRYRADRGAEIAGKLPSGITVPDMAALLGMPMTGDPDLAPGGDGAPLRAVLQALGPWMPVAETLNLDLTLDGISVGLGLSPDVPADRVAEVLLVDLRGLAAVDVASTPAPLKGTTRIHALTGLPQVFRGGWLPELDMAPTAEACANAPRPDVTFEPASLRLDPRAVPALNQIAALVRICTGLAGLKATLQIAVDSGGSDPLNDQLARRRADVLRALLTDRGVRAEAMSVAPGRVPGPDALLVRFD